MTLAPKPLLPLRANPYESDEFLAAFPQGLRPGGLALTKEALAFCRFPAGAFLVDLGCGTGTTLEYLSSLGFQVLGLDSSDKLLALAALKGPVQKATMDQTPLADQTVSGLFCECVLSLAKDKAQVLGEIKRVLKPGGYLIISDLLAKTTRLPPKSATPLTCAAGAESLKSLTLLLTAAGFTLRYRQDHEKALKSLAASLVWRYGSIKNLAYWLGDFTGCLSGVNLTYGLLVAQAPGPDN
ncbi:MAG: class I SAM-dependent methyltransferase [Deltaproteobacteria bacterium]|jgi:SAM-dependent methyltransferase|nr:class I SAM-dependent methyltransferase [Deltaproteobacteria bacterium]